MKKNVQESRENTELRIIIQFGVWNALVTIPNTINKKTKLRLEMFTRIPDKTKLSFSLPEAASY